MKPNRILPPREISDIYEVLDAFSDHQFNQLVTITRVKPGYSLTKAEATELAAVLGIGLPKLAFLVSALQYLQPLVLAAIETTGVSVDDAVHQLVDDIAEGSGEQRSLNPNIVNRLASLLEPLPDYRRSRKIERLQDGFIDNAVSFATLVDIRPYYEEDQDGMPASIGGYIPVVQLRMETNSMIPALSEVIVNLKEDALAELKAAISRAESKLLLAKKSIDSQGDLLG